jgi:type 1 fimbriae regulatory protein FimE
MPATTPQTSFSAISEKPAPSPPRKRHNKDLRSREYLTKTEVDDLLTAAKKMGKHGQRNTTLILLMYRHGLRAGEAATLRWEQVDLKQGILHVSRLKNGTPSTHPLRGIELRALRQLQRESSLSPYVFQSQWKQPLSDRSIRDIVAKAGQLAALPFPVHPHMLRHGTGYYLASNAQDTRAIQAYLGHKNIQHTVRYTELAPNRFKDFWQD